MVSKKVVFTFLLLYFALVSARKGERVKGCSEDKIIQEIDDVRNQLTKHKAVVKAMFKDLVEVISFCCSKANNISKTHKEKISRKPEKLKSVTKRKKIRDREPGESVEDNYIISNDSKDWVVMLSRVDDSENFARDWKDYKYGFRNGKKNVWVGLKNLYRLTKKKPAELHIELIDWDNMVKYADYKRFKVGSEREGYKLYVSGYSGTAGDSLSYHDGMKFSTFDNDQDEYKGNCAKKYGNAGWWYKKCMAALLTGKYMKGKLSEELQGHGVYWYDFHGSRYSLKSVTMTVRPRK